jgi:NADH-ubiquinone oxidoreductase chain 5
MLILIVLLPLFGFFSGILFGRYLNVCFITTFFVYNSCLYSFLLFFDVLITGVNYKLIMGSWIDIDKLQISWSFLFDSLTSIMLIVVTFISTLVHLYSTEYMENDPHLARFMSYLSLFTFFMLILITASNFLQMFVGWEGVGLSSYLLINFWFTRIQANKAAIKAMLANRVGDFALLIAIFLIYINFGSLNYDIVFSIASNISHISIHINNSVYSILDIICFLLFVGAMGKSAQLGLHIWLPDAMEGPTPVSALIHAATMVTAGIFLIARCSFLFEFSPIVLTFIVIIGSSTAFAAATIGLFQNDMKKVIAYSTCSQLGYMIFACGLSSYDVGLFHLSNHAFFKALLFLSAGSIIHAVSDEQDMRKMGGLQRLLPFSYAMIFIGSAALIGFPFLTGFYSKDAILELAYAKYTVFGHYAYFLGSFAAFCTAFYSMRLLNLVFLSNSNGNRVIILNAHEPSWRMILPLCLLCFLSINIGFLTKDLFIGFGTNFWGSSLFVLSNNYLLVDSEFIPTFYKIFPLICTILGSLISFFIYNFKLNSFFNLKLNNHFLNKLILGLNRKWFFDRIYTEFITQKVLNISYFFSYQNIDRGFVEQFGPFKIVHFFRFISNSLLNFQNGSIFHYMIILTFSIYLYILFIF